jgi:hypothetical protein
LTSELFGLPDDEYHPLVDTTDSLIHCAASLNRKSEKQCLNVNLRGTLEVIQLARRAQNRHGLRRYSHVSTVAVAGKRQNEVVTEDAAIDWRAPITNLTHAPRNSASTWPINFCWTFQKTISAHRSSWGTAAAATLRNSTWFRLSTSLRRCLFFPAPEDKIDIVPANYVGKQS